MGVLGRIVVTGASGVAGTALVKSLMAGGNRVVPVSRADCDLLNFQETVRFIKYAQPDIVFHLAGKVFGIQGNKRNKGASFFENALINTHVVEAARLAGAKKVVAMGTVAAYSDVVPRPMREDDIWMGRPHASEESYGHAKRAMLAHLNAYQEQYGLQFAFPISTNLYGPNDRFDIENGHVVPSLIAKFYKAKRDGTPVEVWGDGSPTRDFLYATDLSDALIRIAENGSGAINLASGMVVTIRQLVETLSSIYEYDAIVWNTAMPNGQDHRVYNLDRLKALGFSPSFTLEQGLRETVEWFAKNQDKIRL